MKRHITLAVVVLVGISHSRLVAEETIRVATFNIANLGVRDEYKRSLIALTNIIRETNADLICIQEVQPNKLGKDQIKRLTELLNKAAQFDKTTLYDYAISSKGHADEDEVMAFLWRDPVSMETEIEFVEHEEDPDGDGKRTFQRVPIYALFKTGDYDFWVVNCHLYTKLTGSSEGRPEEYKALVEWLKELQNEGEKDAILVGDFNRFLNGKSG